MHTHHLLRDTLIAPLWRVAVSFCVIQAGIAFDGSRRDQTFADTVELNFGGEVDGRVTKKNPRGKVPHVIVEVDDRLSVAVPQSRIGKTLTSDQFEWYQQAREAAGDDAEAHYKLAIECKRRGMEGQRTYHHQRAIALDPNHSKSRRQLGYTRSGNEWILYEEQQRRNGMILVRGGWKLPEQYAREKRMDEAKDASNRWIKKLARLRKGYLSNKSPQESLEAIRAIDDPFSAQAISDALIESRDGPDPVALRRLYVKKLGSFKNPASVQALVRTALDEPYADIRLLALEQLKEYGAASAVATYLPILSSPNPKPAQVTAALRALNHFPDPELWRQYIDALETTYKTKVAPGPGMQVGQNSLGGAGLAMGGKEKVRVDIVQNPAAVELLKTIAPGVDFRYDKTAWRRYFADQLMRTPGNLRRDP